MAPVNVFEQQYQAQGFASQRQYPNESFLAFLGSRFFHLPFEKRGSFKFLEVGCGSGANLWAVAKEGFQAHGIDLSPTGLDYCRAMLRKWQVTANLCLGDVTDLPYDTGALDVIFDVVTLQHLPFQAHFQAWGEIYRCLKNGGAFFSYHLGENSISLKCGAEMIDHCTVRNVSDGYPLANNGPICFLSANEARKSLSEIGFKSITIEKVVRSYSNQTVYIEYLVITAGK